MINTAVRLCCLDHPQWSSLSYREDIPMPPYTSVNLASQDSESHNYASRVRANGAYQGPLVVLVARKIEEIIEEELFPKSKVTLVRGAFFIAERRQLTTAGSRFDVGDLIQNACGSFPIARDFVILRAYTQLLTALAQYPEFKVTWRAVSAR